MTTSVITIGAALIKMGTFGGVAAVIITGIKWWGGFNPTLSKKKDKGGSEGDIIGERLSKKLAERS